MLSVSVKMSIERIESFIFFFVFRRGNKINDAARATKLFGIKTSL